MIQPLKALALATALVVGAACSSAQAAEREQVRMVINLISGVKMPFPENLRNNLARTERVQLDTNGATVACLRLDDKIRWCYEHIRTLFVDMPDGFRWQPVLLAVGREDEGARLSHVLEVG